MKNTPLVSIVIATFNSERLLPKVLSSIRAQTYPAKSIEVLIVDGGSDDATRHIAATFKCRIIDNPRTLPFWAKYIGYKQAKGDYLMYLDSDEVICSPNSIERKVKVFLKDSSVHALTGSGYISPKGYIFLNRYINEFGDPFSFSYYRLSKDARFFLSTMEHRYPPTVKNNEYSVFSFLKNKDLPIFELVAMGSMVDLQYLKRNFPEIHDNADIIPHLFHLLVSSGSRIAIVRDDILEHYSSGTWTRYLGKITSRIMSNVYTGGSEGFRGRDKLAGGGVYKKYLFIPYAFCIILPLMDAIFLSITRRSIGYLVHVPLCIYTASLIIYYMLLKALGVRPVLRSYGHGKKVAP